MSHIDQKAYIFGEIVTLFCYGGSIFIGLLAPDKIVMPSSCLENVYSTN